MLSRPLAIVVALVATIGWVANLASYLFTGRGDPQVNVIFGLVIGGVFALNRAVEVVRRRGADMLKPIDRDPAVKDDPP
jgi:hypothetical protein